MTDSAHLDKVAEAICRAEPDNTELSDAFVRAVMSDYADYYRRLAQAAIDACGLTEETKQLADGMAGQSTNMKTGETTVHSKPCTKMVRLVGPWGVA